MRDQYETFLGTIKMLESSRQVQSVCLLQLLRTEAVGCGDVINVHLPRFEPFPSREETENGPANNEEEGSSPADEKCSPEFKPIHQSQRYINVDLCVHVHNQ